MQKALSKLLFLIAIAPLAACTETANGAHQFAQKTYDNAMVTKERFKTYMNLESYQKPVPPPIPERYCYRSVQDITCYENPIYGAESRLVGAQVPLGSDIRVAVSPARSAPVVPVTTAYVPPQPVPQAPFAAQSRWPKQSAAAESAPAVPKASEPKPLAAVDVGKPPEVKATTSKVEVPEDPDKKSDALVF